MAVLDSGQLTRDDLRSLLEERHAHCVSLYLQRAQVGQETPPDDIRLKNLVRDAVESLVERGVRRPDAERMMEPAQELIGDSLRWQAAGMGMALFLSEDGARRFRLPHAFEDLVIVNDRFHIEQLVPLLHDDRFYILALQRQFVRLYEATPHSITQISMPEMPGTLRDTTQFDEYPNVGRNWHSSSGTHPGRRQQMPTWNGQKDTAKYVKIETEGFFRAIDGALMEALKLEKAPLVIAALAEEVPEYRTVNTYQHLMDEAIVTGPQLLSEDELHHRAWEIVRPEIEKAQREALDRFNEYAGTQRASDDLTRIVPAAVFGRVESLFVPSGVHLWGRFDATTGEVTPHTERQPGDEDLIDVAASYALATRGEVFQVPTELMPERALAAAVFRY